MTAEALRSDLFRPAGGKVKIPKSTYMSVSRLHNQALKSIT